MLPLLGSGTKVVGMVISVEVRLKCVSVLISKLDCFALQFKNGTDM